MGGKTRIFNYEKIASNEFAKFSCDASNLMEKKKIKLSKVKLYWSASEGQMCEEADKAHDITFFLWAIFRSGSQGPYAYTDLSSLLSYFCGKEGEELVTEYERKLKHQLDRRVEQNGKEFIVKVDGELDEKKELNFRSTLAKLFNCEPEDFLLVDIRTGCTELVYIISAEIADSIQSCILLGVCVEDLKNAQILQLTLEG